jgi:hypothetical protein
MPRLHNITMNQEKGFSITGSEFSYGALCELLHVARPIFLSSEPYSFEKAMGVVGKAAGKGTAMGRHQKFLRETYEKGDLGRYVEIRVNDIPIFNDKTLNAWLNGIEYHQDAEKVKIVEEIESVLTKEGTLGVFAAHLTGRVTAIYKFDQLVSMILQKANEANTK